MVDALACATAEVLLEKAISLATNRIGLIFGLKKDIESLKRSAAMICAVLADAEDKQKHNLAVQLWLQKLEGVAFDADHVLDELNYEVLRRKVEASNQSKGKVCLFFSFSKTNIAFGWRMASKVRDINMRLNKINQEANDFGLVNRFQMAAVLSVAKTGVTVSRKTDSLIGQTVVGRANDELEIVETLLSFTEKVISVLPIVGMGGLGKTTLAKLVYNNQRIDGQFNKKIWVCVSEKFEIIELFKLILESLTQRKVELDSRDAIIQKIRKELEGHRYLLVLDDVWNQNLQLWEDFFRSLVGLSSTNGNWCLMTTRLLKAASIAATNPPYLLEKLSDDNCWSILKEKVAARGEVPRELKVIRKEVIQRCCGLPLTASVIGGLLCLNGKEKWLSIFENRLLNLSGDEDSVMQILKLSFDYLPSPPIKNCFAYCSMFAKDTEMQWDVLVELWMAEGFLQPNFQKETTMEEIGDNYFKILLQSSLLEEIRYSGGVYYKMHDLVHDLAKAVLKSRSINLEASAIDQNYQVRYLAINTSAEKTMKLFENISTSVRTLFLESSISGELLSKLKNLHVLNLSSVETSELPTAIGKLTHLRYIAILDSAIETLPESLCKLYNLQTLRIDPNYSYLNHLPKGVSNLISLRHLHYYDDDSNFQMPLHMGRLSCLQTLEFYNVGEEKGHQIEELGCLKDLKGKLAIRNLELVKNKEGAEQANLSGKENLFGLKFEWGSRNQEDENCDQDVLEGLRPHSNLLELEILNFMGDQFPQWFMNLSALVRLQLKNCKRCRELPAALGQLPFLQHLELIGLEYIRCIGLPFYGIDDQSTCSFEVSRKSFPALKTLILKDMENLVDWMEAEGEVFPVLESLTIKNCKRCRELPVVVGKLPFLQHLELSGLEYIRCIGLQFYGIDDQSTGSEVSEKKFPTLKTLILKDMENLLEWMETKADVFPVLEKLTIENCSKLSGAPSHFPSLKKLSITNNGHLLVVKNILRQATSTLSSLKIKGMSGLTCVSDVAAGLHNNLSNLKKLELMYCPNLASTRGCGSSLESLRISACGNLSEFVEDQFQFQSLRSLWITGCPRILYLNGLQNLTSLQELSILYFDGLTNLPGEMLHSCNYLQRLAVYNCPNLVSFTLDMQQTPSLLEVEIYRCPKLKTNMMPRGFGFLTSLRKLLVGPISDNEENASIDEFDWAGLISSSTLRQLGLRGFPHMESLPDQLQYLATLTNLHLIDFGVEALPNWIGNLASLEYLRVVNCKKLQYLPSIDAMKRLTKLTSLQIIDCPLLKERCISQSGPNPESHKISRIRNISIRP